MSVERTFHCDGPDCSAFVRTAQGGPPATFIETHWEGDFNHFCTWDCVMKYAAKFDPPEILGAGES